MPKTPDGEWSLPLMTADLLRELSGRFPPPALDAQGKLLALHDEQGRLDLAFQAGKAALVADLCRIYHRQQNEALPDAHA